MKAELVKHPLKGVCILISDLQSAELQQMMGNLALGDKIPSLDLVFTDIDAIASQMRRGMKIAAIKEVRSQTGWGLKEAKEYIDRFWLSGYDLDPMEAQMKYNESADLFIRKHMPKEDFLQENDLKI